ncbi:MAG: phage Gp37/Gp68 family protein [Gammaproteobacteria bacterium]|nr:phage Gp37/Gp68 family protein [Gammaproteobacteria bacterium]MYC24745.1 phage Gp37/Gp68 family protein [Gammaproteobacteria bacterium]
MSASSKIEWTDTTWNPVTGCTKVSHGCKNCYAERMSERLKAMGAEKYSNGFEVTLHASVVTDPLKWKQPRRIFVNSMSDLFHEDVPISFIQSIFHTMNLAGQHVFQVLTKRPVRVVELNDTLNWTKNIWLGTSIESRRWIDRLDLLKKTSAKVKFLSLEPLLGPLPSLQLDEIDWVIVGGESGPGARPMRSSWVREIRDQCVKCNVSFFFKQWGGVFKTRHGRTLDDRTWDEIPDMSA